MWKVFLVEDESVIREGLRDNIPWEQYGYRFVGEAQDGEMALPLIRKTRPDVLITDIKMPFMDGLSLSKIVGTEFPDMKIIIISGYDDFEYARQAIEVGVDQYLLKPITRMTLKKVLLELRDKMEQDREQKDYQLQFQNEMREYEQFSRRHFFERLLGGELSVKEIYEEAARLSIEMTASCYNLLFFSLQEKKKEPSEREMDEFSKAQDEIMHYFLRHPRYVLFRWNINSYGVLIKAEQEQIEEYTRRGVEQIQKVCTQLGDMLLWHVAAGEPVERLSMLADCYQEVNHYFACRFLFPEQHILTQLSLSELRMGQLMSGEEFSEEKNEDYQNKRLLKGALAYIDLHFCEEELSLNQVAKEIGVSTNYFSAIFSQSMQKTFTEYVTAKRMEYAKSLLKNTEKSSGEIATEVGYKDPHYFSFVFKKTQGLSPREYRAKKQAIIS